MLRADRRDRGMYLAYVTRQFRPYIRAAVDQFSPKRRTVTERVIEKLSFIKTAEGQPSGPRDLPSVSLSAVCNDSRACGTLLASVPCLVRSATSFGGPHALAAPNYRTVMRRRWRRWDVVSSSRRRRRSLSRCEDSTEAPIRDGHEPIQQPSWVGRTT
jgi:hypothetical protein